MIVSDLELVLLHLIIKTNTMSKVEEFSAHINQGYTCKGEFITLGGAILNGEAIPNTHINIPLKTLNRH